MTLKETLMTHTISVHEVRRYLCNACNLFASQKVILRRHEQSVHEGKKYPCDTCDFLATQKGNL